ncbi:MAG: protein translocase subunit SecD [Candidatus Pacebacteria bacterium]|nr:protein translocase subunit SecD [Candidatus Paceibacterota bacterium]
MKNKLPLKTLVFLILLAAVCLVIALPAKVPIELHWKNIDISNQFDRPALDLSKYNIPFKRDLELKMGLDIQGGTRVVLEADMSKIAQTDRESAFQSAREIIARRVDLYGVSESTIKTSFSGNTYRIIVELPGVTDASQAVALIGTTAQLDFREESTQSAKPQTQAQVQQDPFANFLPTGLTGKDLKRSGVQFSSKNAQPIVTLEFSDEGKKKFGEITARNVGKRVGIFLDDFPVTLPSVNEAILSGIAEISGGFTVESAKQLSVQLNAGALPVPIQVVQQETVGASLGKEAVEKTARAGLIGVGLVALFMILLYGWKGMLADLALAMYALITIAIYKLMPITLTLPGIAGLLLSIGMVVDSNILIFERMKEELRLGKPFDLAMRLGFGRAWDSIKDANVATLFTSFILFNPFEFEFLNRSGMVRGFALTLALGILVGLFTGIVVTRTLLRIFLKDPTQTEKT